MDPLSALGIAAAVVQFLDFGSKLVTKSTEIYNSAEGSLLENQNLEAIASNMLELSKQLEQKETKLENQLAAPLDESELRSRRHRSKEWHKAQGDRVRSQRQMLSIAGGCKDSAIELLDAVERLKLKGDNNRWTSFRQAWCAVWRADKVDEMRIRLERFRDLLNTNLLASISEQVQSSSQNYITQLEQLRNLETMEEQTQAVVESILGKVSQMDEWKAEIVSAIYQQNASSGYGQQSTFGNSTQLSVLSDQLSRGGKAQWAVAQSHKLIERLNFQEMSQRKARITVAHKRTFGWVYAPPDPEKATWSSFIDWLEGGDDLYWITGKPGSGKSTLMKYLFTSPRTAKHASRWSRGKPIIQAGFFFWNSGTDMQMSNLGLVQTLLYECLIQRTEHVQTVFPDRWRRCELFGDDLRPWTWEELLPAFHTFCQLESRSNKLLFFLDGLDEFRGKHQELVELVRRLAATPNIKVCASSRPWLVFEDAFKLGPNLMLQDLTIPDILNYVADKPSSNHQFAELKRREPQYASKLEFEIAKKSSGVFLWVHLVVESLLDGLTNSDRIIDLKRRLEMIPPDLDGFYESILNSSDNFYFEHASQLFQMLRKAQGSLSLLDFSFADEENPDTALEARIQALSQNDRAYRCEAMRRRINSRTKGLLDVPSLEKQKAEEDHLLVPTDSSHGRSRSPSASSRRGALDPYETFSSVELASLNVEYLHRTVRDFLDKPEVWNRLLDGAPPPFDAALSLARACLLRLKDHSPDSLTGIDYNMWHVTERCVTYLSDAESTTQIAYTPLRRELERLAQDLDIAPQGTERVLSDQHSIRIIQANTSKARAIRQLDLKWLRSTVAGQAVTSALTFDEQAQFYERVRSQVMQGVLQPHDENGRPLLTYALLDFEPFSVLRLRLLRLLLESGADPNEEYLKLLPDYVSKELSSPWRDAIIQMEADSSLNRPFQELYLDSWVGIAELLIDHGADRGMIPAMGGPFVRSALSRWNSGHGSELSNQCKSNESYLSSTSKKSRVSRAFSRLSRKLDGGRGK
ncbi:Fc.00g057300.m01.CDS01 [Cosmosporella sp. VM-42]